MAELTPRDDAKKTVSEILKRVDQLIKKGDFQQSLLEIERAKEIDPRNVYIHAYEERLLILIEEDHDRKEADERRKKEEEETRKNLEEEWKKKEEERQRKNEEELLRLEEERKKKEEERKKKEAERTRLEEETRKLDAELREAEEELKKKEERGRELAAPAPDHPKTLEQYKQALHEVWADGAASAAEEAKLAELRSALRITPDEHKSLEATVKRESYMAAFKRAWSNGSISPEAASSLADLRKKFKITSEEHEHIEVQLLWELRSARQKASIVVVDDDEKLLQVIKATLEEAGFDVKEFLTSDEAYRLMKHYAPDIILSDINLETSTMGGFSFYEKVREIDHLQDVPFIFLSGLTDEVLIRTGKELGVDDYLTKPFSDQTLISTIKGKLKRYEQLKKRKH